MDEHGNIIVHDSNSFEQFLNDVDDVLNEEADNSLNSNDIALGKNVTSQPDAEDHQDDNMIGEDREDLDAENGNDMVEAHIVYVQETVGMSSDSELIRLFLLALVATFIITIRLMFVDDICSYQ